MKKICFAVLVLFILQGCTSWKYKDGYPPVNQPVVEEAQPTAMVEKKTDTKGETDGEASEQDDEPLTKYSELSNMAPPSDRQYKRMTRQKMEEDSELYGSAGSLWKMEGQTSYLFAENKHRREGDPTSIKMEGSAIKLVENKVAVIQDLLKQLEDQRKKAEEDEKKAEKDKQRLAQIEEEKKLRAERKARGEFVEPLDESSQDELATSRLPAAVDTQVAKKAEAEEKVDLKEVELIPSKIVEKMADGIYRIRGQQYLTIKKKPYKVIATALVREEDFSDVGVSSSKLLDAQYDVIHVKRATE